MEKERQYSGARRRKFFNVDVYRREYLYTFYCAAGLRSRLQRVLYIYVEKRTPQRQFSLFKRLHSAGIKLSHEREKDKELRELCIYCVYLYSVLSRGI